MRTFSRSNININSLESSLESGYSNVLELDETKYMTIGIGGYHEPMIMYKALDASDTNFACIAMIMHRNGSIYVCIRYSGIWYGKIL